MNRAYWFRVGVLKFILNIKESSIGYCYPRIFIAFPDNSYLNCDLSLCRFFNMSEEDWFSWLDGTQISVDDIDEVRSICEEAGINWDLFEKIIFEYYEMNKGE